VFIAQPGDRPIGNGKARHNQQETMSTFLISGHNLIVRQGNQAHNINKIAKDMTPLATSYPLLI
jgi:hypothetical protein